MNVPKFSLITPTWNRADGRLSRCLESVYTQTYRDFEHVVVDDGSDDGTESLCTQLVESTKPGYELRYIRKEHEGRVVARNVGMREAGGDWIAWVDSDDALDPMYLETFDHFTRERPEVDLWVTGAVVHGVRSGGPKDRYGGQTVPYWTKLRRAWIPPLDEDGPHVHRLFHSGHVGTGMFVFRRECLDTVGYFPDSWRDHDDIADGIDEYLGLPPGTTGYGTVGPPERPLGHVGNPYGEDHCLYQKLCLHYRAHKLGGSGGRGTCLYVHYVR